VQDGRLPHKSGRAPDALISQLLRQLASLLQQVIPTSLGSQDLDLTQLLRVVAWEAHGEFKSGVVAGTHSFFLSIGLHSHSPLYLESPVQSESLMQVLTGAGVVHVDWKQTFPNAHSLSSMQEAPLAFEAKATQVPASHTAPNAQAESASERGAAEQSPPTAT